MAVEKDGRALWREDGVGFDSVNSAVEIVPVQMRISLQPSAWPG